MKGRPSVPMASKTPHPTGTTEPVSTLQIGNKNDLSNKYLLVSNLVARDGGKKIIEGNNRVIAARLSDAKFFWEQDKKTKLEDRLSDLENITFHAKLGTQRQRVERIEHLAGEIAQIIGADVDKAKLAARLCKADLVTGMVGEFPELQGLMGSHYARAEGLDGEVAYAIATHYKPQGPSDDVPQTKVAQAVALVDKLDTLVGFFGNSDRPTGSSDPFALRRATLGVIRIVVENQLRLPLVAVIECSNRSIARSLYSSNIAFEEYFHDEDELEAGSTFYPVSAIYSELGGRSLANNLNPKSEKEGIEMIHSTGCLLSVEAKEEFFVSADASFELPARIGNSETSSTLLAFFADRLKVYLRDQGARHDLIDAVFALGDQDDLLMIVKRVEALGSFLDTDDGKNLLAGFKRASNILKIEEKNEAAKPADKRIDLESRPLPNLLVQGEEKELNRAIAAAAANARKAVKQENFEAAMSALAKLRAPVDAFFEKVTVNADDPNFRENRLRLLNMIRQATLEVADFSKIEG